MKLTGYQRFILSRIWLKGDKELTKEEYIKRVCELKGLEYVEPIKVVRSKV